MHCRGITAVLCVLALLCAVAPAAALDLPAFDVPRLEGIAVDGQPDDWADGGFRVEVMGGPEGQLYPPEDFEATMRIGWNDEGLLVLVAVTDEAAVENADTSALYFNDSVELFLADSLGSANRYQVIFAPGAGPEFGELRSHIYDHRPPDMRTADLSVEAASRVMEGGYLLEALLPWSNLGVMPEPGAQVAFNVFVNDSDGPSGPDTPRDRLIWYPSVESWQDSNDLYRLRLADEAGPPSLSFAAAELDVLRRRVAVRAVTAGHLVGCTAVVSADGRELAREEVTPRLGRGRAVIAFEFPPDEPIARSLTVQVAEGYPVPVSLADVGQQLMRQMVDLDIRAGGFCFSDQQFPAIYFPDPLRAENLLGEYRLSTEFYNAEFEKVETPSAPGRYGAVVTIEAGRVPDTKRYRTLFHHPMPLNEYPETMHVAVELPEGLGIDPALVARYAEEIGGAASNTLFQHGILRDSNWAAMLAGLYERDPDSVPEGPRDSLQTMDRQWWVTMKRKLTGMEERYPNPLAAPRPIEGDPAPLLREGTPQEAGMAPDVAERLDALLTEWQQSADESFAVCIARHGVIVLHRAYPVDDPDYSVNTPTWMASITKLMSGTLMMMLVDQGLVDLDAPVADYLPAFRGIEVETPLTVRHLYTHTNGLWDHWGDEMHDLEHVVAMIYPELPVGKQHSYNGVGYGIGGKIIEMISGEAVPVFYAHHLLGPLGCEHTMVQGTYGDAMSVPLDMARIGQMLLNRGAYGSARFFSEETFQKMLPRPLSDLAEQHGRETWGIGTVWMNEERPELTSPSARAFGHGAASAATLIIDPESDLVIVMTRNAAGANYGDYHPRFVSAVYDSIAP